MPEYQFLSNFFPAPVVYRNVLYSTVEHAYQASKTVYLNERELIRKCSTASSAKMAGKSVTLRANWELIKLEVMLHLLRQKFAIPVLRDRLINTGEQEIIEGNWWGDTYWGVCRGNGQNNLGKLLMKVRAEVGASAADQKLMEKAYEQHGSTI